MRNIEAIPYTTQLGISVALHGGGRIFSGTTQSTLNTIPVRRVFARALGLLTGIKAMSRGISGGKQNGKICQCKNSRSTLFILSKRNDDLIVMLNVRFEFRQNKRHYYLL